jgi:hypothetical protein
VILQIGGALALVYALRESGEARADGTGR